MKPKFLLPNQFKLIGWILIIPSAILGLVDIIYMFQGKDLESGIKVFAIYVWGLNNEMGFFKVITTNIADEISLIFVVIGAIFIAFSREKQEDEFIGKARMESLVWATYVNYGVLILSALFVYGFGFLMVMGLNMFTILIFFIVRFNYILYKAKRSLKDEK